MSGSSRGERRRERREGGAGTSRRPTLGDLTRRQRGLLLGVLALMAVVGVGLLEVGLRIGGYGDTYPLFIPFESAPGYLRPNPDIARRYFSPEFAVLPPQVDLFRAEKPAGGYRIVVQGGSTAAGFPYPHGGSFSNMLQQRLQETFPERPIEVVNTALPAISSYTLLDFTDEIIEQSPDAVLVYAGHNEYYGAFGVGSAVRLGSVRVVRSYLALRNLRTVQLLGDLVTRIRGAAASPAESGGARTLMARMASDREIRYGSGAYEAGIRQFRANLADLLERYRRAGIPVYVATLASNEGDQPPFVGEPAPGPARDRWSRLIADATAALERGETEVARLLADSAAAIDSTAADAFFLGARSSEREGRLEAARDLYRDAKDRDRLPFRAPEAMNRVIRAEAARHGATVVDAQRALGTASPDGIIGRELMTEHLHPRVDGQFIIADAFFEALRTDERIASSWEGDPGPDRARSRVPVTAIDSVSADYAVEELVSDYPFVPLGSGTTPSLEAGTTVERLALDFYRGRVRWPDAVSRLRDHYMREGRFELALKAELAMAQRMGFWHVPYLNAGRLARGLGRPEEALFYYRLANRREPTVAANLMSGGILAESGRREEAAEAFRSAARLQPGAAGPRAAVSALEALPSLEEQVSSQPEDVDALLSLAQGYTATAQFQRAEELVERILELDPGNQGARELGAALEPMSSL